MIELGKKLAVAAAVAATVGLAAVPRQVEAGGIGPGAAVGLGLGAFALGSTLANPYAWGRGYPYSGYGYYGYGGYPAYGYGYSAPGYYPQQPAYPRYCWTGYQYVNC